MFTCSIILCTCSLIRSHICHLLHLTGAGGFGQVFKAKAEGIIPDNNPHLSIVAVKTLKTSEQHKLHTPLVYTLLPSSSHSFSSYFLSFLVFLPPRLPSLWAGEVTAGAGADEEDQTPSQHLQLPGAMHSPKWVPMAGLPINSSSCSKFCYRKLPGGSSP